MRQLWQWRSSKMTAPAPRFSLIVATVGRTQELERLLLSLARQKMMNFEVLIIDQNQDRRVRYLLDHRRLPFPCLWLRSSKGLSRARNLGLLHATGEILAFPDDDCWYPDEILDQVSTWFDENEYDFLLCSARDERMQPSSARWPKSSGPVGRESILGACISFGLFVRRAEANRIGPFDENLGLGSSGHYGSGEDTDYGLRLLSIGKRGWYEQNFFIHHPNRDPRLAPLGIRRAFLYGSGYGHLLRKHRYPSIQVMRLCLRALGGACYSLCCGRMQRSLFYIASFAGRVFGYLI